MRLALAVALLACTASPAPASGAPVWVFIAKTSAPSGGPITETPSKSHATEDACDEARSAWIRAQTSILIVELGQCQPVPAVVPAKGK